MASASTLPAKGGTSGGLREWVRRELLPRRHTALLAALVAAFAARPMIGDVGIAPLVFSLALIALMLVSLYTVQIDELVGERERLVHQKKRRNMVGWFLAIPALGERLAISISRNPAVVLGGTVFWLLFFGYITWCEFRAVLKQKEVTAETISMSISVYLLMGLTWGVFYIVLYYLQPQAFSFGSSANTPAGPQIFPVLVYFSLTTISTIGFGDITPVTDRKSVV